MLTALAWWNLGTHVLVALVTGVVAIVVLTADARRNSNQWLAGYLALVSGNFLFLGLANGIPSDPVVGSPESALLFRRVQSLAFVCLILDPAVLAYFASLFPRRTGLARRPWLVAAVGGLVVAFLVYEVATQGLSRPTGGFHSVRLAFFVYLALGYGYAGVRVLLHLLAEPSEVMAAQLRVVALGALVVTLPRVALVSNDLFVFYASTGAAASNLIDAGGRLVLLWGLFAGVLALVARAEAVGLERRAEARRTVALAGAVFVFFSLMWAAERGMRALGDAVLSPGLVAVTSYVGDSLTFTTRWVVFSAAMVYGIVRYQVLAATARTFLVASGAILAVASLIMVVVAAGSLGAVAGALLSVATLVGGGGALWATARLSGRRRSEAFLHERAMQVYRSMLAAALAEGRDREAALRDLAGARARLGVTSREHEVLIAIAEAEESRTRGPRLLGRYEVVRRLGAGGYATVYLARDGSAGGLVVLKRIRDDHAGPLAAEASSLRELEVARRVSHPHLVSIHDVVRVDDGAVIVMEHVEGGSLRELIERAGPVGPVRAAEIVREALAGLAALHEAGLVHGDLKPENVLVTLEGRVKLADFGSARARLPARTLVRGTLEGVGGGTLLYMAPEQLRGARPSVATDVYAMGAILHELVTGRAFQPGDAAATAPFAEARARALADDPAARFASAAQMAAALAPAGRGATSRLPSESSARSGV